MMWTKRLQPILAGLVLVSLPLAAQVLGRINMKIIDADGKPVQGAKVTLTCADLPNFHEDTQSSKRGRAVLAVADATRRYTVEIAAEGYLTVNRTIKPDVGTTKLQEFVLMSASAAPPAEGNPALATPKVAKLTPAEEMFNEGIVALQADDIAGAKERFAAALAKNPDLPAAHSALAGLYFEEKNYDEAMAAADRLLALEPDNPRGMRVRYEVFKATGQNREAKAALAALSAIGGGETGALVYNEGVEALKVGDRATAKLRFQEALEVQPDLAPALAILAALNMDDKAYTEAASLAERALAVDPANKRALQVRYDAYQAAGETAKAEEAFAALAAGNPQKTFQDLYEKGIELFNGGDAAGARDRFVRAAQVQPEHGKVYYHLALSYTTLGDSAKARESFERFLTLAPDDADASTARDMLKYLE